MLAASPGATEIPHTRYWADWMLSRRGTVEFSGDHSTGQTSRVQRSREPAAMTGARNGHIEPCAPKFTRRYGPPLGRRIRTGEARRDAVHGEFHSEGIVSAPCCLGTFMASAEGLHYVYILDVSRPSSLSRLIAATYGEGGQHPCRRAVNRPEYRLAYRIARDLPSTATGQGGQSPYTVDMQDVRP